MFLPLVLVAISFLDKLIVYDNENQKIGWTIANCKDPPQSQCHSLIINWCHIVSYILFVNLLKYSNQRLVYMYCQNLPRSGVATFGTLCISGYLCHCLHQQLNKVFGIYEFTLTMFVSILSLFKNHATKSQCKIKQEPLI